MRLTISMLHEEQQFSTTEGMDIVYIDSFGNKQVATITDYIHSSTDETPDRSGEKRKASAISAGTFQVYAEKWKRTTIELSTGEYKYSLQHDALSKTTESILLESSDVVDVAYVVHNHNNPPDIDPVPQDVPFRRYMGSVGRFCGSLSILVRSAAAFANSPFLPSTPSISVFEIDPIVGPIFLILLSQRRAEIGDHTSIPRAMRAHRTPPPPRNPWQRQTNPKSKKTPYYPPDRTHLGWWPQTGAGKTSSCARARSAAAARGSSRPTGGVWHDR